MTHMRQMSDNEGEFKAWEESARPCKHCGHKPVMYRIWESNCGGYEDYQYQCTLCKRVWWVDGIDA